MIKPRKPFNQYKVLERKTNRQFKNQSDSSNKRLMTFNDTHSNTSDSTTNLHELMDEHTSIHSSQVSKAILPKDTTVSNSNIVYKDNPTKINILNDLPNKTDTQIRLSTLAESKTMKKQNSEHPELGVGSEILAQVSLWCDSCIYIKNHYIIY